MCYPPQLKVLNQCCQGAHDRQDQQQQFHAITWLVCTQEQLNTSWLPVRPTMDLPVGSLSSTGACCLSKGAATHPVSYALSSSPMGRRSQCPELLLMPPVPAAVQAIDYAAESGAFAHAFEMCKGPNAQHKLLDVHLKYAMWFEDEGEIIITMTDTNNKGSWFI